MDLRFVTIDDLPNADLKLVAQVCGLATAVSLIENMPGVKISIPKNCNRRTMQRAVMEMYNGTNVKSLSAKLGISERQVYRLLQSKYRRSV